MRRLALLPFAFAFAAALAAAGVLSAASAGGRTTLDDVEGTVWAVERFDGGTNTLAGFDAATGRVLGVVAVGRRPIGVTAPRGTGKVYSADERSNQLTVVSKRDFSILGHVAMGPFPHHMMATRDGRLLYVAQFNTNTVGVVDTSTDTRIHDYVASANPLAKTHAVWITRDGTDLYATNEVANSVSRLDAETGQVLWEFPIGNRPSEVLVTRDGKTAYVTVRNENKVKVLDVSGAAPVLVAEQVIGVQPDTMQLSHNRKMLVVGLRSVPQMAIMDTRTLDVRFITFPGYLISGHQWLSPDDRFTFIALESMDLTQPGAIAVVENRSGDVVTYWPYPGGPWPHGVFFDPQERDGDD